MGLCLPPSLSEETLQGFKYFRLLGPLFDHLHRAATERDRAGNRQLFYDQYASLLLLYFFNPVVTSLRGLQQTTTLATVQERLGIRPTSLSALSEAAYVFDAALLHEVLTTLGARLRPHLPLAEQAALAHVDRGRWQPLASLAAHGLGPVAGRPASGRQDACGLCGPAPGARRCHGHGGQRVGAGRVAAPGATRRLLRRRSGLCRL